MTQNMHICIAFCLLCVTWHVFLKKYFFLEEERAYWRKRIKF